LFVAIYIAVGRDPSICNIFARFFCYDISVLNFPDDVRRGVIILKDYKGRKGVPKYCDIFIIYFGIDELSSFKNCQSFCGVH